MTQNKSSIAEIIQVLNERAPLGTAEDWDNVGLLAGDPSWVTQGAVVSIDLTFEAVELAVQNGYHLILNHHPCIFPKNQGLSKIVAGTPLFEAIQKKIAVAAFHTNFDRCALEVVQKVASGLGLEPRGRLIEGGSNPLMKLVTFIPQAQVESVRNALTAAGAGHVGAYDYCTFETSGQGTFRGDPTTRPAIGIPGEIQKVSEVRLETIFPRGMQERVLEALIKSHPYEEVAYDLIAVEQSASCQGMVRGLGYGFWGEFPTGIPFSEFAKGVKRLFNIHGFWITGSAPSLVSRVGFVAGKGASFVEAASAVGCDLFVTGEVGYHPALGGSRRGMTVIELGHRESETFFVKTMANWLSNSRLEVIEVQTPTQTFWSGGTK